jgi:hypothetical protein
VHDIVTDLRRLLLETFPVEVSAGVIASKLEASPVASRLQTIVLEKTARGQHVELN